MRKNIILTFMLAFAATVQAQITTITVDSVGKLSTLLPDSIRFTYEELKVCGPLNTSDIKTLQLMANRTKPRQEGHRLLRVLDLSEVTLPEGKGLFKSKAGVLPVSAFMGCKSLERVVLPESSTEISRSCFSGCSSLKEIVVPKGITAIGDYAFANCAALQEITIPETIDKIGSHAFDGCQTFTDVKLPEGLTFIESYTFSQAPCRGRRFSPPGGWRGRCACPQRVWSRETPLRGF